MAFNCSERSIGESLISGIELHIGKSFIPPAKVTLPLTCDFRSPSDVLFMEYDFSLETQVIAWSENEHKQREEAAAVEPSIQTSETEEDDSGTMSNEPCLTNGRLPHPTNMGNANTNATVTNSVAQFSHVATATATPAAGTASAHHSDILTPTLVIPQAAPQDTIHEPTINLADFEREENPFDEVELKTINDMEVLHDVLLPTLPAQNGLVPAGTGNSIHNDPGLTGGQTVPLPDIPATRCLVQTSQTVNALPQSTAQHMSASYPQRMPTPFVSTTNQDSVQIYSTGSVRYSPPSGGRTSMSHPLKSSRSSPDISNNTSHAAPRVMPEPPVYTPPRHPSHTPPPRPSHLQDSDKDWNRYQLLPSQQQRPLNNGTPDVRHPPLSLTAVTLIRQVTDMGFPQDRVEKAVRRLGDDDRKVLDYLCLADRLVEQHYKIDDVETSLELFENNGEKAALYLQLLTRFREMGFSDDKIQVALVGNDLDVDLATESLM